MMNKQMNLPAMQKIMMEFERQSQEMDMKQEVMDETVDDALGDEDEDEETYVAGRKSQRQLPLPPSPSPLYPLPPLFCRLCRDQLVAEVLAEVGLDISGQAATAPQSQLNKGEEEPMDDLQVRAPSRPWLWLGDFVVFPTRRRLFVAVHPAAAPFFFSPRCAGPRCTLSHCFAHPSRHPVSLPTGASRGAPERQIDAARPCRLSHPAIQTVP